MRCRLQKTAHRVSHADWAAKAGDESAAIDHAESIPMDGAGADPGLLPVKRKCTNFGHVKMFHSKQTAF
jgi:hypothetical protein